MSENFTWKVEKRYGPPPLSPKWLGRFYRMADLVSTWSKDPDKKVGCVLISPCRGDVAIGYNGFPRSVEDDERLDDKATKRKLSAHAETNAIINAARDLRGWTLISTEPPCLDCALAIIQAGIVRVVAPGVDDRSSWAESQRLAEAIMDEAGISVEFYDLG